MRRLIVAPLRGPRVPALAMKILQCHNLYQLPGGEDSVARDERTMLEGRGHGVIVYNRHNDDVPGLGKLSLAARTVWNRRTTRDLTEIIRRERPDVAHFHNTMALISPSGYYACRAAGVPVVQTLHNYRFLCPKSTFFRDDRVCEDCLHKRVKWPSVAHACYRGSRSASAVLTVMSAVHHTLGTYQRQVDAYIACSEFTRDKMIEGGFPGDRIFYKPNFVTPDPGVGSGAGGYALYLGRLVTDKGIGVLAEAWGRIGGDVPLRVIGKGPAEPLIADLIRRQPSVRHDPWVGQPRLGELLGDAAFLVLPTLNYEGLPRVIVEAYAMGVPVIASNLGAMSRVIDDGVTGRHVKYNDSADLERVVRELHASPDTLAAMRRNARHAYETLYTAERNYATLMDVYAAARGTFDAARGTAPLAQGGGG